MKLRFILFFFVSGSQILSFFPFWFSGPIYLLSNPSSLKQESKSRLHISLLHLMCIWINDVTSVNVFSAIMWTEKNRLPEIAWADIHDSWEAMQTEVQIETNDDTLPPAESHWVMWPWLRLSASWTWDHCCTIVHQPSAAAGAPLPPQAVVHNCCGGEQQAGDYGSRNLREIQLWWVKTDHC
jgi:hypothetical protein